MTDQATQLRKLVQRAAGDFAAQLGPAPRLLVVSSGQCGVGATTVAVNLSVSLAHLGQRIVLIDGDLAGAAVAARCGVPSSYSVVDVLTARRDIHEVLQPGPSGIQIAPGSIAPGNVPEYSESALQRLLTQMRALGRHAEMVVIDAGPGATSLSRRFWEAANQVLLITTAENESIMETYATLKLLTRGTASAPEIGLILNQAVDGTMASEAFARFQNSCEKFLGREVTLLGWIPHEERLAEAGEGAQPLVRTAPTCAAARAIERIAATLAANHVPQRRAA